MIVEYTKSFDGQFVNLSIDLQKKARQSIEVFIDCYVHRQFPKGLRVHKCGPFLSLSLTLAHRIFVRPIPGGIKFIFIGNHEDVRRYLREYRNR